MALCNLTVNTDFLEFESRETGQQIHIPTIKAADQCNEFQMMLHKAAWDTKTFFRVAKACYVVPYWAMYWRKFYIDFVSRLVRKNCHPRPRVCLQQVFFCFDGYESKGEELSESGAIDYFLQRGAIFDLTMKSGWGTELEHVICIWERYQCSSLPLILGTFLHVYECSRKKKRKHMSSPKLFGRMSRTDSPARGMLPPSFRTSLSGSNTLGNSWRICW